MSPYKSESSPGPTPAWREHSPDGRVSARAESSQAASGSSYVLEGGLVSLQGMSRLSKATSPGQKRANSPYPHPQGNRGAKKESYRQSSNRYL